MIRTQIYLTENEQSFLKAQMSQTGKNQSELIREAIDLYAKKEEFAKSTMESFGMWSDTDIKNNRESLDRR